nr:immunoglobulin light chain junction region [Macaca mulatta]
CQQYNDWSSF